MTNRRYQVSKAIPLLDEFIGQALEVWVRFENEFLHGPDILPYGTFDHFRVELNDHILTAALEDARIDLSRWADFHLASKAAQGLEVRPDHHKLGGFTAQWVAKMRPIQVICCHRNDEDPPEMPKPLFQVNAAYASALLRSYLPINGTIPVTLLSELMYRLHFRSPEGLDLAYFAYTIEEITNSQAKKDGGG